MGLLAALFVTKSNWSMASQRRSSRPQREHSLKLRSPPACVCHNALFINMISGQSLTTNSVMEGVLTALFLRSCKIYVNIGYLAYVDSP